MALRTRDRVCFVIMPFSETASCTEAEWTDLFASVIKPAVEGAEELGYECRRSSPTRGNLVKEILDDLRASHVVLADLTDRNANVFYELGVRHALATRTILIAQRRNDIPFDLSNYANHVYEWKTDRGRAELSARIRSLLEDIDAKPDRSDNPVSDFLGVVRGAVKGTLPDRVAFLEQQVQLLTQQGALLTSGESKPEKNNNIVEWIEQHTLLDEFQPELTTRQLIVALERRGSEPVLRAFMRRTERVLLQKLIPVVAELAGKPAGNIRREEIPGKAEEVIKSIQPLIDPLEQFALEGIDAGYENGTRACIRLSGSLVSASEGKQGVRFATGSPAFAAWRLLLLMGAKAVDNEDFASAGIVLNTPLEVVLLGNQVTHEPLWRQRRLFHPETFLGHADYAIKSVAECWDSAAAVKQRFQEAAEFRAALAVFLVIIAIRYADQSTEERHQLYPGYRLIQGYTAAVNKLVSRLKLAEYREKFATLLGESSAEFATAWERRAGVLNAASLGSGYWPSDPDFPASLELGN